MGHYHIENEINSDDSGVMCAECNTLWLLRIIVDMIFARFRTSCYICNHAIILREGREGPTHTTPYIYERGEKILRPPEGGGAWPQRQLDPGQATNVIEYQTPYRFPAPFYYTDMYLCT